MVRSIPEVLNLVQQHQTAVMLETMQYGTLTYQEFIDKPSSKYYMLMKQKVYWQGTIIMASKTWPFMEQLNRIVFMQQQSGIGYYWEQGVNISMIIDGCIKSILSIHFLPFQSAYRLMDYDIQRSIVENGKAHDGGEPVKLSIQHILGALFLWMFGNSAGILVFVLEKLWNYNKKNIVRLSRILLAKIRKYKK